MQVGRTRTVLAAAAALVVLTGFGAGCSSGGSSSATSSDPCEQIADDAVASWQSYQSKHGDELTNPSEDAKADMQALQQQIQDLETQANEKGCKIDEIGNRILEKDPNFFGRNRQTSTAPPTSGP